MRREDDPPSLACQSARLPECSSAVPKPLALLYSTCGYVRRHGLAQTAAKIAAYLRAAAAKRCGGSAKRPPLKRVAGEGCVLDLQPGDLVEVKSEPEIRSTLDIPECAGLPFLPEMQQYCGNRYVVFKRVERIFLEESGRTRRLKNTVLLRDVICDGLHKGCDRSCFFFWREAWLRRIPGPPEHCRLIRR